MRSMLRFLRRLAAIETVLPYRHALRCRLFVQRQLNMLEPETKLLKFILKAGDHVLDVGTNAGVYTYLMSRLKCRVESFEPLTYYADLLESADLPNVKVHAVALSTSKGDGLIHIPIIDGQPRRPRASIVETPDESLSQRIELMPLDEYGFDDVRFIKIDVEGHEWAVLRGGEATIERCKPMLLVEIEQHRLNGVSIREIFDWIESRGYAGYFYRNGVRYELSQFAVDRDQAVVDNVYKDADYINNFIFLSDRDRDLLPSRI